MAAVKVLEVERHYSVAAVAELLEVSTDYVYARIKDGSLLVVELGTSRSKQRISASVLQTFLDRRTYGTADAAELRAEGEDR
jgi:excisionase family DNA binding protein